jgi:hypothetical protein
MERILLHRIGRGESAQVEVQPEDDQSGCVCVPQVIRDEEREESRTFPIESVHGTGSESHQRDEDGEYYIFRFEGKEASVFKRKYEL